MDEELRRELTEKIFDAFNLSPEDRVFVEKMAAETQTIREMIEAEHRARAVLLRAEAAVLCERLSTELSEALGVPLKVTFDGDAP